MEQKFKQKVEQLPEHSAILYIVFSRDSEGETFVPREILSDISRKANVPTFGILDTYLDFGIVGGSLLSAEVQGRRCAEICLRIISGEPPVDIVPERTRNIQMFDARLLLGHRRWQFNHLRSQRLDLGHGETMDRDEILRKRPGIIIVRHRLGFVLANAGIDQSNVDHSGGERALLLPVVFGSLFIVEKRTARAKEMVVEETAPALERGAPPDPDREVGTAVSFSVSVNTRPYASVETAQQKRKGAPKWRALGKVVFG